MRKNKSLLFSILFFGALLLSPLPTFAQGYNYKPLENIPGVDTQGNIASYVQSIYDTALILTVLCAVFMLTVGGFMYMTSAGNTSRVGSAKNIIYDAIFGLVLALIAWLILNIINPDLVKLSINGLSPIPQAPSGGASGAGTSPTGTPTVLPTENAQSAAKTLMSLSNVNVANSGSCKSSRGTVSPNSNLQDVANGKPMDLCFNGCGGSSAPCTANGVNPSEVMLNSMNVVASQGFGFTITSLSGGSHAQSSNHYKGKGVDIVPSSNWQGTLDAFKKAGALGSSFCESPRGENVSCTNGGADHIHLNFP